jgi:hypothetical protein
MFLIFCYFVLDWNIMHSSLFSNALNLCSSPELETKFHTHSE